jgi:hypothetical protein
VATPISGRSARAVTRQPCAQSRDSRMERIHRAPTDLIHLPPVRASTLPAEQVFGQRPDRQPVPAVAEIDGGAFALPPSIPLLSSASAWGDGYYLKITIIGQCRVSRHPPIRCNCTARCPEIVPPSRLPAAAVVDAP